jgi:hypothetical protein
MSVPDGYYCCEKCRYVKPIDMFPRSTKAARGYESTCKQCRAHRKRVLVAAQREGLMPKPDYMVRSTLAKNSSMPVVDWDDLALELAESIANILQKRLETSA